MMKAAICYTNGPPSVLRYGDMSDPTVSAGEVLIRVAAISVEGGDVLNRRIGPLPSVPHVVGYQASGIVERVGAGLSQPAVGDRVAAFNWAGSHAELFVVPAYFVYPLPGGLEMQLGATIPVAFGTADDALFERGKLQAGETVLVNGGAGGVGLAAIQLAKAAKATVIATASGAHRVARLADYGADYGIDYRKSDVAAEVLRITGGEGAHLVVDLVGGAALAALTPAMTYGGRVAIVGAASSNFCGLGFVEVVSRSLSVLGVSFGQEMHSPRAHAMIAKHMSKVAVGVLRMPIDRVFPLSEAALAHEHVERGHPYGRVIMVP